MEFPHIARWLHAMADSYGSLTSSHSLGMGSDFPTRCSLRRSLWLVLPQSSSYARDFMKANFRKSDRATLRQMWRRGFAPRKRPGTWYSTRLLRRLKGHDE